MKKPVKFGKYYLLERINIGGMAEVFKAKSFGVEGFEKLLAIKRILPNIAEDEDFITMFIDEAKIAVQLNHANIAQIYDLGKIDDSYFIALEYVAGKDLRTIWERHKKHNLLLPIPLSAYAVIRMCEGLDYAHRKKDAAGRDLNIVHRDVSPQNILVSYEGEVKIIDFGIAKAANKASKTQAGILKGKFGYMSPEQVRGLPLDRRADIFSAGIILYELLTGERLFVGESDFSTLEKVRNVEILPPSTYNRAIPDALEKIVLRALSKDPDDRFQSAYDMQEELQRFLILNKTNFARKDLAAYMKRAFKADIEREMARQAEYQTFSMDAEEDGAEFGAPGASARPASSASLSRRKVPVASAPAMVQDPAPPPPAPAAPAHAIAAGGDDDDDDDIETVVFDTRGGLPEDQPTGPTDVGKPAPSLRPPPLKPKAPAHDSGPRAAPRRPPPGPLETVTDAETTAPEDFPAAPPEPPLPEPAETPSPVEAFSTSESTMAGDVPEVKKRSRLNLIIGLLAVVAVAVVGLAVFKFLQQRGLLGGAVTLTIQATPPDAEILLDGKVVGNQSPVVVKDVKSGSHTLEARKENYQPYQEPLELKGGENRALSLSMTFIPAELVLTVEPTGVRVTMDDHIIGDKSPLTIPDVLPGVEHAFAFERLGYETRTEKWTFKPREKREEKVALQEISFDLEVDSDPSGAKVTINGEQKGTTPTTIKKLGASHQYQLSIKHPRFPEWSSTIRYEGAPVVKVTKNLEGSAQSSPTPEKPQTGSKVEPPKPLAKDDTTNTKEPKKHKNHTPKQPEVAKPEPPKPKALGKLRLNSTPWGNVWLDGKDLKRPTPLLDYELPAGKHTLTIHFANGDSQSVDVDINPGETTTKIVKGKM